MGEQKAPETKAAGVKLDVAVQIDETTAAATKTKLETALGDKSGVATKLAAEGVETEPNSVVSVADVEQVSSATATDTVEVTQTAVVMEVEVQVDEAKAAETQKKLEESFSDKAKVAEKLGEAGVVKEDGSAITTEDVKDTTVAKEVTKEVDVKTEDLPENVQNIVEEEEKGGYTAVTESLKKQKSAGANSPSPSSSLSEDDILGVKNEKLVDHTITIILLAVIFIICCCCSATLYFTRFKSSTNNSAGSRRKDARGDKKNVVRKKVEMQRNPIHSNSEVTSESIEEGNVKRIAI